MSDLAIEEKIRKIREDLYNFNLGEQSSLERYLEENQELQFSELDSELKYKDFEKIGLKSSQSAEDLNNYEEIDNSPQFSKYHPESTANYQEFTLNKDRIASADLRVKGNSSEDYNKALLASVSETKSQFLKKLSEKDEKIQSLEKNLQKAELELKFYTQGKTNIDDLKSSTRELIYKADELDSERKTLIKENSQLHQRLLNIEKELNIISSQSSEANTLNQRLVTENKACKKKIEEMMKENEILYQTLRSHRSPRAGVQSLGSLSPRKQKASIGPHRNGLKASTKRFYSDDEKTERKTRSPGINAKNKLPRPKSKDKEKERKVESSHIEACKAIHEIMNFLGVNSPNLAISMVKAGIQEKKLLVAQKDFFQGIQKIVLKNSPPGTFKGLPGLKTSANWVKRLVKEYLNSKKNNEDDFRALEVLKTALNSSTSAEVPKAVSKLLVENERLLRILSKLKRVYRLGQNVSIEELEREIEVRS